MTYTQWVAMNVNYEEKLLSRIKNKFGELSKEYKIKLSQINDLKNGNS